MHRNAIALRAGFVAALLLSVAGPLSQAVASDIVRVEEDWELVVGQPDAEANAPQVTCIISPVESLHGQYAAFDVNHHSQPSYRAGGLQLQLWNAEVCTAQSDVATDAKLAAAGETVRWTTRMSVHEGKLTFQVRNGTSDTWGSFGGWEKRVSAATALASLNSYTPETSVQQSGVGFAANRVQSLKLVKVRRYDSDGQFVEDATERLVQLAQ